MAHEEFEENLALYATGALDRPERQALETHLMEGCKTCHAALKEYREIAGLLPHGLPATSPPEELKLKITAAAKEPAPAPADSAKDATGKYQASPLAATGKFVATGKLTTTGKLSTTGKLATSGKFQPTLAPTVPWYLSPAFTIASVVLVLVLAVYAFSLRSTVSTEIAQRQKVEAAVQQQASLAATLQQHLIQAQQELGNIRQNFGAIGDLKEAVVQRELEIDRLRTQMAQKEQEIVQLYKTASPKDEMLILLNSSNVRVVSLTGAAAAKSAGGLILYDPDSRKALLYAFNMPALQRGKTYQLWAITTKPISAGTFGTDPGRKSRHLARAVPATTKFAVSLEPEGGRPQPTGAIYLAGQL